jgi:hypothetical protein
MLPLLAMMSGTRKLPPISINSPRDTIDSIPRQAIQGEDQRGGAVVHDQCILGASQFAEQRRAMHITRTALAGGKIVLEVGRTSRRAGYGVHRHACQRSAAEVRVQQGAGGVEDRS